MKSRRLGTSSWFRWHFDCVRHGRQYGIFLSIRADAAAKSDSHYKRWLQPNTLDAVGGIQVEDKVLLWHGSVEYAAMLKKHGYSPLRAFRVVEVMPEYNALR
eukprot:6208683-Pleurochrysis_carterae.AAC.1